MKKSLQLIRKPSVQAIVCSVILAIVIVFGSGLSNIASSRMFPVKNLAPGFQVVEFSQVDRVVRLTLKNNYPKGITAYVITASLGTAILTHSIDSVAAHEPEDRLWRTGETATFQGEIYGAADQHNLTIRAVIFEDLTTDGEAKYAQQIFDKREGDKLLFDELLPQLQALKIASDKFASESERVGVSKRARLPEANEFATKLIEMKGLASNISRQRHRNLPPNVEAAYRSCASMLRQQLEEIEIENNARSGDPDRTKLSVDRLEARVRRMRGSL